MPKIKKQHYVPQVFLKKFSFKSSNGKEEHIHCFDKTKQKCFTSNVKDIASKNYFYDFSDNMLSNLPDKLKDPQALEKALSKVENGYSQLLNKLMPSLEHRRKELLTLIFEKETYKSRPQYLSNEKIISEVDLKINELMQFDLDLSDKSLLSVFLAFQYLRTEEQRKIFSEIFKSILDTFAWATDPNFHNSYTIEITDEGSQTFHILQILEYFPKTANHLLNQKWWFGINLSDVPLCTSDHPLALDPNVETGRGTGIKTYGVSFNIPISPNFVLIILDRSYFEDKFQKSYYYDKDIMILNEENAIYYNDMQLLKCYSQIYSNNDNFEWAKEYCKSWPDHTQKDRKRLKGYGGPFKNG